VDPDGNMGDWPPFRLPLLRRRRLSDGCSGGAGTASAPAPALPRPGLRSLEELEGRREDGAPAAETDAVEAAEGREVKQMKSSVPPPPPPRSRCLLRRMRGKRAGG